jgi:phosphoribosylformimino-5-aminoimidazole carboxamide ribotide isomerase
MKRHFDIIPAIDLIDGSCVRLTEGDYTQKTVYHKEPLDVAKQFEDAGLTRLHLVDLDGAKAGRVINWSVLEKICTHTRLQVDFGGGIKTEEDLQKVMDSGAAWAVVGSIAVKDEDRLLDWFGKYGTERFFLGADVKQGKIAVSGWMETTAIEVIPFLQRYVAHGIRYAFCTDVSKDGRLEGPSVELYRDILASVPGLQLVASGGVSTMADLQALASIGCHGAILGKAIYEGRVTLDALSHFPSSD